MAKFYPKVVRRQVVGDSINRRVFATTAAKPEQKQPKQNRLPAFLRA